MAVKSSLKFNGQCQRRAAGSCRQVESHYNRPLISTNREHRRSAQHPWWHTKTYRQACINTHTHTQNLLRQTTAQQYRPGSLHPTRPPAPPSHHYHQGPDHTVGRRPATGGHVLAFSRVKNNNTSGLISSSTSQLPGLDISSRCYCFA